MNWACEQLTRSELLGNFSSGEDPFIVCPMAEFKEWLEEMGVAFPVPRRDFTDFFSKFWKVSCLVIRDLGLGS